MNLSHKFRLYPSKQTEQKLLDTLELCRQTYNSLLEELNQQKIIDKSQIQGIIPDMKICEPKLKSIYSKTLQYECYRLFSNLKALTSLKNINIKVGKMRFKGKGHFKTFVYNQSGFKLIKTGKRLQRLYLSKIGEIPIKCHRKIRGKIKQIIVKKARSGRWFALIVEECNNKQIGRQYPGRIIGIDVGLHDIVYDSDGNSIENPHHIRRYIRKISFLQRKLSKKRRGSKNYEKTRVKLTKQYEKLTDSRNDFLHNLSRFYVNRYGIIGMEDLKIKNMVKNRRFSKYISDASWGRLRKFIAYKAERAGKLFLTVNYKGTTQRCSQCGNNATKGLQDRTHTCPNCGFEAQRDYNSALEIRRLMLVKIRQELPKSTLAEMEALPSNWQLLSMNQETLSEV